MPSIDDDSVTPEELLSRINRIESKLAQILLDNLIDSMTPAEGDKKKGKK